MAEKYFPIQRKGKVIPIFRQHDHKINEKTARGYIPQYASVRLIVWWKNTEDKSREYTETEVILPDIHFKRTEQGKQAQ